MHRRLPVWFAPVLLTAAAGAQGNVGLSFVGAPRPSAAFSNASLGNGVYDVRQVGMIPHPNGTPGLYLGGMSVSGLPLNLGGRGSVDVVAFTYDRITDTVTLSPNAFIFNASGDDFSLHWGRDGTYATAERVHGRSAGPYHAMAAGVGGMVGPLVPVAGLVNGSHICPSTIGGVNVLFYTTFGGGIAWRTHDLTGGTLTGPTNMVTPNPTGANMHSPFPVVGGDGDAEAILGCEANALPGGSEWNWQGDLDPTTTPLVMRPTPTAFENNGCEAGGRVYMPRSVNGVYEVYEYDVVGLLGDTVKAAGGTLDLTAFSPSKTSGLADVTIFVQGHAFLATPMVISGIENALGLDPAFGLLVLGLAVHSNATGRGTLTLPTPPLGAGTIPVQGLTLLGGGTTAHFTSTALITIVP